MILYPAIDILEGSAVRLVKGDFDAKKIYDEDPLDAARGWTVQGAKYLHVVDLDGAKTGAPKNLENLKRIAGELGVPVQYGGGLRSAEAIAAALDAGATRVILGTAAMFDPTVLRDCLAAHGPERILVGVDVRGGDVVTHGWVQGTDVKASVAFDALREKGVRNFIFTNVDRDGMLEGPDLEEVRAVAKAVGGSLIYSGGIGGLADLEGLAALGEHSLEGVIVGKALYERRFTVAEAQAALGR